VIERVLKITNAPTRSAMPPKPSSTQRIIASPSLRFFASSFACLAASLTCVPAGRIGPIAFTSCAGEVPCFAATEIESKRPSRCSSVWAVLTSQAAMLANPSESMLPKDMVPATAYECFLPSVETTTVSPTL
jgi:hypothetical protein